jgi:hypothetical protein
MIWYDMIWYDMTWYDDIFNCSWVAVVQYTYTQTIQRTTQYKQYIEQQKIHRTQTIHRTTKIHRTTQTIHRTTKYTQNNTNNT